MGRGPNVTTSPLRADDAASPGAGAMSPDAVAALVQRSVHEVVQAAIAPLHARVASLEAQLAMRSAEVNHVAGGTTASPGRNHGIPRSLIVRGYG